MRGLQAEGGALTSLLTTAATGSPVVGFPSIWGAKKVPGSAINVSSGFLELWTISSCSTFYIELEFIQFSNKIN